jgi:hypothetical protein
MELPHWVMVGGAVLLVISFICSLLHESTVVNADPDNSEQ